ncbi:BMP family lipoprotein [Marinisporobacter balticus]|uniref:Nucleoside-binding protein n=1 Tax=Marinisporobacter balticus TaxID=2018667 RepID=A0A4R2LJC2_9FIRM|nr:BMP family ABC transporter substrate-binding protein [Marinisporobacter balticus]TCO79465.1 nucleoside-binding protein [Marinisporobacter balticus]
MFKKRISLALVLLLCVGLLAGCGQKAPEEAEQPSENQVPAEEQLKIAMTTDVGGVNDQSFNQSAWEGLQRAEKELGIVANYKESKQDADYGPNMETLLDDENNLIWGIGFKMGDLVKEEAEKNPDQKYAIIDYAYDETPENLVGVVFKAEQPSFLVGYIAAKMTKTGKVGFVGGVTGNVIDGFEYGYKAGVKAANNGTEVLTQYADSFTDSAKGKAIANQMYKDGADIVFHAAGGVGDGVIEAAKEQNKFAIGVDRDQNALAPENVITSAMKRVDNAVFNMAKDLKEGKFPGGTTVVYGLKEGGVDIAPTSDKHVPADILKEVEDLKQQIINEKIVVPYNEETFNEFK